MHHFQFNKSEVVNGTCAKSGEPSDLTVWLKGTCIFLCICIKNIYMYAYIYIYSMSLSVSSKFISKGAWSLMSIYTGKRASTTLYHLLTLCSEASTKVPFPLISSSYWYRAIKKISNSYATLPCAHHWLFPMEEMKYTYQPRNSQLFCPCSCLQIFAPLSHNLDTGKKELRHLINWLVCTGILPDPILHCWGQEDDLCKAL